MAKTKVKSGQDPVFDETFELEDIPADIITLTITVMNKGKRAKDAEVAELTVDLSTLKSGSETEDWYQLSGLTPIGEWGSLRLKLRSERIDRQPVLPRAHCLPSLTDTYMTSSCPKTNTIP